MEKNPSIEIRGDVPCNGQGFQLDRYRPLLRLQIRKLGLSQRLRRRFDSSDLIQETLLRAHLRLADFRGATAAELIAWMQQILANVVADEVRRARAGKRDIAVEQALDEMLTESSLRLEEFLATGVATPLEQAQRSEELLGLAAAIERLPEDQRDVVIHRDLLGTAVAEIAESLGKSPKAVAGLLLRGRRRLRELLGATNAE